MELVRNESQDIPISKINRSAVHQDGLTGGHTEVPIPEGKTGLVIWPDWYLQRVVPDVIPEADRERFVRVSGIMCRPEDVQAIASFYATEMVELAADLGFEAIDADFRVCDLEPGFCILFSSATCSD